MTLDEQLQALKDAERRIEAPPHLEVRIMTAFANHTSRAEGQPRWWRAHRWPVIGALAAGVIVGVAITLLQSVGTPEAPTISAVPVSESVVLVLEPPGVGETVRVVRIRVARSALENLGIQTVASQGSDGLGSGSIGSDSVDVDVLVGEDGVARGVRLAM